MKIFIIIDKRCVLINFQWCNNHILVSFDIKHVSISQIPDSTLLG